MLRAGSAWGKRVLASCRRYARRSLLASSLPSPSFSLPALTWPQLFLFSSASSSSITTSSSPSSALTPARSSLTFLAPISLGRTATSAVCGACLGLFLVLSTGTGYDEQGSSIVVRQRAQPVYAAVATEESKVVGEAWKVLSKAYVDKTFNGQDWSAVRKQYVKSTYKSTEEAYAAIRSMAATLGDKYTRFLTPSQYNTLASMYTSDQPTAGVGVEIILDPATNSLTVLGTIPGSPAEKSGIKKGDVIVGVDNVKMGDYGQTPTPDDAAALLRGVPGTEVTVKIKGRFAGEKPITLTREVLKGRGASGRVVDIGPSKVGLIKVLSFNQGTCHEVVQLGQELLETGVSGLILDLRGNVGGFFPAAVELGRELLEQDMTIVTVVDNAKETSSYRTEVTGTLSVAPLVVMVDKNTASAAEVLAAALKENGRAKIVGETTFGKGLIQTIARLADGSALVVTVAEYRTPLNNDINKKGIEPDIAVTCAKDSEDFSCIPITAFVNPVNTGAGQAKP